MARKILIVHAGAPYYADHLSKSLPQVQFVSIVEAVRASRELPEDARPHLADADAIVSIGRWADEAIIDQCKKLKWFQCLITGTDHLQPVLRGKDIVLTNARGIHGAQMAELALLHMFAHMRRVPELVRQQAEHKWVRLTPRVLRERHVVILGVGAIAESVAKVCKALGMKTTGVSRSPRQVDGFDEIVSREDMMSVVGAADFVLVLLASSTETDNLIGRDFFASMRKDSALINLSRGSIVDEAALREALEEEQIAFAGLDVFKESPLAPESPFWDMPNVFITPFIGGHSDRYDEDAVKIVEANTIAFLSGQPDGMRNIVKL